MDTTDLSGPRSRAAFDLARALMPGGVNSPVRAWSRLGGRPPVIERGEGPWLIDVDGRRYVDYVLSWGPLLHGHAHPAVVAAITAAAARGTSFGAPTPGENALARVLVEALPALEQVRLVNSGTEATMSALRLARAATGRDLVVKCDGCYHGHADHLLVAAGSGAATFGAPDSAGVPAAFAACTLVVPYNDAAALADCLGRESGRVAALILEPVAGNMGLVPPSPGYLAEVRRLCDAHGVLLIFDEVMTGFRTAWGGEQVRLGVIPDLVCLGKVIGGGLPAAAYGGSRRLMAHLAPEGPCYQAGTLAGNPLAVAAGLATLELAAVPDFYPTVGDRAQALVDGLLAIAERCGVPFQATRVGTMWGCFFADAPVSDFAAAGASHAERWRAFVLAMLRGGIYLAPSPFEAAFLSSVHGEAEIARTLSVAEDALAAAARVS